VTDTAPQRFRFSLQDGDLALMPSDAGKVDNPFGTPAQEDEPPPASGELYLKPTGENRFRFSMTPSQERQEPVGQDRGPVDLAANMMIGSAKAGASFETALGGALETFHPGFGEAIRKQGQSVEDWLATKLDPAYRAAEGKRWATLNAQDAAWADWRSLAMGVSELAPYLAAAVVGGSVAAGAGVGAGTIALAEAAFGGLITGGSSAADVAKRIEENPDAVPRVRALVAQGVARDEAVRTATSEAQHVAFALGTAVGAGAGAAVGGIATRFGGSLAAGAAAEGALARTGKEALSGGAAMAAQGAGQEAATQAGGAREGMPWEPEKIVEAGVAGAVTGGVATPLATRTMRGFQAMEADRRKAGQQAEPQAEPAGPSTSDAPAPALPPPEVQTEFDSVNGRIGELHGTFADPGLAPADRARTVSELRSLNARADTLRVRGAFDGTDIGASMEAARTGVASEDVPPPRVSPSGLAGVRGEYPVPGRVETLQAPPAGGPAGGIPVQRTRVPVQEVMARGSGTGDVDATTQAVQSDPARYVPPMARITDPVVTRRSDLDLYGAATDILHAEQSAIQARDAERQHRELENQNPTQAFPRRILDQRPPADQPLALPSYPDLRRLLGRRDFLAAQVSTRADLPPAQRAAMVSEMRDLNRSIAAVRPERAKPSYGEMTGETLPRADVPPPGFSPQRELFPEVRVGGMGERPGPGAPAPPGMSPQAAPATRLPSVPGVIEAARTKAGVRLPQGAVPAAEAAAINPAEFTGTPLGRVISASQERSRRSAKGWETRRARAQDPGDPSNGEGELTRGVELPREETHTVATEQVRDVLSRLRQGEVVSAGDVIDYIRPTLPSTLAPMFDRIRGLGLETEVVSDELAGREGQYDPVTDTITIDPRVADPALVLAHELVHAATLVGYRTNARVRGLVDRSLAELRDAVARKGGNPDQLPHLQDGAELIAGALSDPEFADWLDVPRSASGSIYGLVKQAIGAFLGLKDPNARKTLSEIVDYANRLMMPPERQDALRAALQSMGRGEPAALGILNGITSHLFATDPTKAQAARDAAGEAGRDFWRGVLYSESNQQVVERNLDLFINGDLPNLLQQHFDLSQKRDAYATRMLQEYQHVTVRWRDFRSTMPDREAELARLKVDSTLASIHPDRPSDDPSNAWGVGRPGGKAKHADLSARWASLHEDGQRIFRDVRDIFERDWQRSLRSILEARMEAAGLDPTLAAGVETYDDINRLATDEGTKQDLKAAIDLAKVHGPYFPLRRTGKYFAVATSEWRTRVMTGVEMETLGAQPETVISSYSRVGKGVDAWKVRYRNRVVESHNTMDEAQRAADDYKRMTAKFDWKEAPYVLSRAEVAGRMGEIESTAARSLVEKLEGVSPAAAELARRFFYERVPDTSVLKQRLKRRGIAGADTDMLGSFGTYAQANAYHQAQVVHGRQLQGTINAMREFVKQLGVAGQTERSVAATDIYNHLVTRDRVLRDIGRQSQEMGSIARQWASIPQLAAFWALAGTGSVLTNATQPLMFTFPTLAARHGVARTMKAMGDVYRQTGPLAVEDALRQYGRMARGAKDLRRVSPTSPDYSFFEHATSRLPKEERDMIRRMADLNRIDFGLAADVRQVASETGSGINFGRILGLSERTGERVKDAFGFVNDFAFIMPQAVESINRIVTATAAYRLAKEDGIRNSDELDRYVARSLDKTQWLYSQSNKPLAFLMGGPLLRPMLTFKNYPQHVWFTMMTYAMDAAKVGREQGWMKGVASEPGRVALGITGMAILFSGVKGAAFEPLWWMYRLACWFAGADPDLTLKQAADNVFGEKMGDVVRRGIPAGLGMDMGRVGISNMFLSDNGLPDTKDKLFSAVGQIALGAPGGMFAGNTFDAIQKWRNGDLTGAASVWLPHAANLQDAVRAWDLMQRGQVDGKGNVITPPSSVTPFDVAIRALGFQPSGGRLTHEGKAVLGLATEERRVEYAAKQEAEDPRKRLVTRYVRALQDGDDPSSIVQEMTAYNKKYPMLAITRQTLHRSYQTAQKKQVQMQDLGFSGNKHDMMLMREIMDAYDGSG
jgi:hypothetical protein